MKTKFLCGKAVIIVLLRQVLLVLLLSSQPAYCQSFLTDGLVAYFPFDGGFNDATGHGNDGINFGGTIFGTDRLGNTNSAASFNGTTTYVRINNNRFMDGTSNLTISVWYRFVGSQSGQLVGLGDSRLGFDPVSTRIGSGGFEDFGVTDCVLNARTGLSGHREIYTNSVWRQLVLVHSQIGTSNSASVVYLQGSPIATNQVSQPIFLRFDRNMQAQIGAMDSPFFGNNQHWLGDIDEVRFYNRAFSDSEVQQLFAFEAPVSVAPASASVNYGSPVTFTATRHPSLPAGSYQWYLGTNPIPGAVTSSLTINSVQAADAGKYSVSLVNSRGIFYSNPAQLSFVAVTNTLVYDLTALMDSSADSLIFQGKAMQWNHVAQGGTAAPGRASGQDVPTYISSTLNGTQVMNQVAWTPTWPLPVPDNIRFDAVSDVFTNLTPALPTNGIQSIVVTNLSARGALTVTQFPSVTNNNSLIVNYADGQIGSGFVTGRVTVVYFTAPVGPPGISFSPRGQQVLPGASVTFDVGVYGPVPITYQWRRGIYNLAGATNASLTLNNVQPADSGDYSVVVKNNYGSLQSSPATLVVTVPPSITTQPVPLVVTAGDTATFVVGVAGTPPFAYQWRLDGTNIPGANSSVFTVFNAQYLRSGDYSVNVSNLAGFTLSSNAMLTVNSPPIIIAQPASCTVTAGQPIAFNATVVGTQPLSFQWLHAGTNAPGANAADLTLAAAQVADAGLYRLVVSNDFGSITSAPAFLTVHPLAVPAAWSGTGGGAGDDVGNACAADANRNFFVAGYFNGTARFGTNTLVSAGQNDVFLAKYANDGQLLWVRRAGGTGFDTANGVAVDSAGNAYVTGAFEGTADFGGVTLTNQDLGSFTDMFVAKYDPDGNLLWAVSAGAASVSDVGNAITIDPDGNVLVAGGGSLTSIGVNPAPGAGRIFLAKFDSDGNALWTQASGLEANGGGLDAATGVGADTNGNIYVVGNFEGPTATFGSVTLTNRGFSDGFLARYDSNGVPQSVVQIGGPGSDRLNAIAVDASGNTFVGGHFSDQIPFTQFAPRLVTDTGGSATNALTSSGQTDALVAKFDPTGNLVWAQAGGGAGADSVRGLALDSNRNVQVTGFYSGAAQFGTNQLNSSGGTLDIFTATFSDAGQLAFVQSSGGPDPNGDFGNAIAVDPAGNSLVVGQFNGTAAVGSAQVTSAGGGDVFLGMFNAPATTPPQMSVQPGAPGELIISWPVGNLGFGVQAAPVALPGAWLGSPLNITVVGGQYVVTIPISGSSGFFRLAR